MPASVKDLRHLLERVLQCERDESRSHIFYYLKVNGRIIAQTHYSHSWRGNTQIDDSMLSKQAQEMRWSNKTWKLLLQSRASKEDYFRELLQKGHISQEEFDVLCRRGNSTNKG
jgi:hypothetical protein